MTDPHGLDLASEVYLTDFLACWDIWTDPEGMTGPLPEKWRTKVVVLSMAGATDDDWRYAVRTANERRNRDKRVQRDQLFNYAVGVLWSVLAQRFGHDLNPRDSVLAAPGKAEQERERQADLRRAAERRAADQALLDAEREANRCEVVGRYGRCPDRRGPGSMFCPGHDPEVACTYVGAKHRRCMNAREPGSDTCANHDPDRICGQPTLGGYPCVQVVSTPGSTCAVHHPDVRRCGKPTMSGKPCTRRLWSSQEACRDHTEEDTP